MNVAGDLPWATPFDRPPPAPIRPGERVIGGHRMQRSDKFCPRCGDLFSVVFEPPFPDTKARDLAGLAASPFHDASTSECASCGAEAAIESGAARPLEAVRARGVLRTRAEALVKALKASGGFVATLAAGAIDDVLKAHAGEGPRVPVKAFTAEAVEPYLRPHLAALQADIAADPSHVFEVGQVLICQALVDDRAGAHFDAWGLLDQHAQGNHGLIGKLVDATFSADDRDDWLCTLPVLARNAISAQKGRGPIFSVFATDTEVVDRGKVHRTVGGRRLGIVSVLGGRRGPRSLLFGVAGGGWPSSQRNFAM
jgi:hypothetical protein